MFKLLKVIFYVCQELFLEHKKMFFYLFLWLKTYFYFKYFRFSYSVLYKCSDNFILRHILYLNYILKRSSKFDEPSKLIFGLIKMENNGTLVINLLCAITSYCVRNFCSIQIQNFMTNNRPEAQQGYHNVD